MPIDPSIALGYKGIEAPNPLAQYGQLAQIQSAQNQNALAQFQLKTAQRAEQDTEAMRNALAGVQYGTPEYEQALTGAFLKSGNVKGLQEFQKGQRETQKASTELELKNLELQRGIFGNLAMNPSDENIKAHLQDMLIQKRINQQVADGWLAKTSTMNPAQRKTFFNDLAQTADQRLGHEINRAQLGVSQANLRIRTAEADPYGMLGLNGNVGGGVPAAAPTLGAPAAAAAPGAPTAKPATKVDLRGAIANGVKGNDLLAYMPKDVAAQVSAIADHRMAPPQRGTARGDQISQLVQLVDPTYDATSYKTKQGIETAFTSGRAGTALKSLNVVQDHLGVFKEVAKELGNNDTQFINVMGNKIAQWTGQAAPTNFAAVRSVVADELTKAILGTAGALGDRKAMQEEINAANSPAQLEGVVDKWQKLIAGQIKGSEEQYKSGGGTNPEVLKLFKKAATSASGAAPAAGGAVDTKNKWLN